MRLISSIDLLHAALSANSRQNTATSRKAYTARRPFLLNVSDDHFFQIGLFADFLATLIARTRIVICICLPVCYAVHSALWLNDTCYCKNVMNK